MSVNIYDATNDQLHNINGTYKIKAEYDTTPATAHHYVGDILWFKKNTYTVTTEIQPGDTITATGVNANIEILNNAGIPVYVKNMPGSGGGGGGHIIVNSNDIELPQRSMLKFDAHFTIVDDDTNDETIIRFGSTLFDLMPNNAGAHNSIYRGKYLGSSVTAEQYAAISAGTFEDLYIGDYWTIDGVNYRIAAFDYWLHTGDTECTTHHIVLVPDANMYNAVMNDSNTTAGGYVGSKMYTTNLNSAKTTINSAFGSSHILNHRELLVNAADGGKASNWAWYDSTVELMSEIMVYGTHAWNLYTSAAGAGFETGIDKDQLPLFALDHACVTNRSHWWLRGVFSAAYFCLVLGNGFAYSDAASSSLGVRPAFGIC